MKTTSKSKAAQLFCVGIAALAAASAFVRADDVPMPHPKNENMMKNMTARHAAAETVHFNEIDGEPIYIISSK